MITKNYGNDPIWDPLASVQDDDAVFLIEPKTSDIFYQLDHNKSVIVYLSHVVENISEMPTVYSYIFPKLSGIIVPFEFQKNFILLSYPDLEEEKIYVVPYPLEKQTLEIKKQNIILWPYDANKYQKEFSEIMDLAIYFSVNKIDVAIHYVSDPELNKINDAKFLTTLSVCGDTSLWFEESLHDAMIDSKIVLCNIPSFEDQGNLITKAMNYGCHPIVPNIGCFKELVKRNRYMFSPGNTDDMITTLQHALEMPSPPMIYIEENYESIGKLKEMIENLT